MSILVMGFAAIATASDGDHQIFRQNEPGKLLFSCNDGNDDYCSSSIDCIITIADSDGVIFVNSNQTQPNNDYYYFNLTIDNNARNGVYYYTIECTDGASYSGTTDWHYEVTPTGKQYSTAISLTYALLFIFILFLFCLCVYYAATLDGNNIINDFNEVIEINQKKYIKMGLVMFSYLLFVALLFFAYTFAKGYTQSDALSNFLRYGYYLSMSIALPVVAIGFVLMIKRYAYDRKIERILKRGLSFNVS
jgi:hypothetical protein